MADKKTLELQIKVAADNAKKIIQTLSSDFKKLSETAKSSAQNIDFKDTYIRLESETKRAVASFTTFGASVEELREMQQKLKSAVVDLVEGGLSPESDEVKNLLDQYKKLGKESDGLQSSQDGLFGSIAKLKSEIGSLATVAAAVKIDSVLVGAGSYALEAADSFNSARNDFGTMLQDMEAGAAVFDNIIKPFNDFTPFDLDTTTQAAKVLMSANVQVKDLTTWLTRMGDLSQGSSQKMTSYVSAFSKAAAKGKADMEVLNVYMDQGVPILKELGKYFGTTSDQVVEMVSQGKVSFTDFQATLEQMTDAGGQYYGGMELSSKSYLAMQEGLSEATKSLAASIGDVLLPVALKGVEILTAIINKIKDSPLLKGIIVGAITAVAVAVNILAAQSMVVLIGKIWAAYAAQMGLNAAMAAAKPLMVAAVAAVGVATASYIAFAKKQQESIDDSRDHALALYDEKQALDEYISSLQELPSNKIELNIDELKKQLVSVESRLNEERKKLLSIPEYTTHSVTRWVDKGRSETVEIKTENALFNDQTKLVQQLQSEFELLAEKKAAASDQLVITSENEEIQAGIDLLDARDKAWAKTQEGQEAALKASLEWAKNLRNAKITEGNGQVYGLNKDKTEAIIREAQTQLDEFYAKQNKNMVEFVPSWTEKNLEGIEKIKNQRLKSIEEVEIKANKSFGENFKDEEAYKNEIFQLELYYAKQVADFHDQEIQKQADAEKERLETEKKRVLELHDAKMNAYKEEAAYNAGTALDSIQTNGGTISGYGDYAVATAQQFIADTDLGSILAGSDPVAMLIEALVEAALRVESINKTLNFIGTIVDSAMDVATPALDSLFRPYVEIFEEIGKGIGQVLATAANAFRGFISVASSVIKLFNSNIKALGNGFEWLNNQVIVPVGNKVIDVVNKIIDILNEIPNVEIDKIERLNYIGTVAEGLAKSVEIQKEKITEYYQAQIDAVESLLSSQISSIQKQYELGLLTREEYEKNAAEYQAAAGEEKASVEQQMADALEKISENTQREYENTNNIGTSVSSFGDWIKSSWENMKEFFSNLISNPGETIVNTAGTIGDTIANLGETVGATISDIGDVIWDGVTDVPVVGPIIETIGDGISGAIDGISGWFDDVTKGIGDWVGTWWPFASGTAEIPYDMPAVVHRGEGIIPKSFNDAIKSGEYALVGETSQSNGSEPICLEINIQGSVVTERQLIDVVYDGLARVISNGRAPLIV